mmetsp:Transcript_18433/g.42327  ORF Transcript_18433/g.42327 Transcript_18433/m.42327 type:complete len:366 (+) Transcript_18433:267-1364(+)
MVAGGDNERRKIRFHGRVQFKTIRHVNEFTDDEIRNGWYDKDDFNAMSDNVSEIAALISKGKKTLNGEVLCTRGLEHIVEEELADYRAQKMISSIDAVLDAQEEQWEEGRDDPDVIAKLYAEYAKSLLEEAHMIGLQDEKEGYKTWDDLFQDPLYQKKANEAKSGGEETTKTKNKKKKVKNPTREAADEIEDVTPPTSFSDRSGALSPPSPDSVGSSEFLSRTAKLKGSSTATTSSMQASFSLQDSISLISEEYLLDKSEDFSAEQEDGNKAGSPKRQRKTKPKRSPSQRKYGTELSPFVLCRDGTIAFKKPEVEKLKKEQKEKRRNCISKSLSDFLRDDDDGDDILAGILSSKPKKAAGRKKFR